MSSDLKERVLTMLRENLDDSSELDTLNHDEDLSVLGVNSMTFIKLVIAAEMEFGLSWGDDDLDFRHFSTINNIVNYVSSTISDNVAE